MALTRIDYISDGSRTVYDLTYTLGYLREADIYVALDGNSPHNQLAYSFLNDTQIELDTPLSSGVNFYIRRIVRRDQLINDYEDGAIIGEDNLNDSLSQALMIQEELRDGYLSDESSGGRPPDGTDPDDGMNLFGRLDMHDHRIINLASPEAPTDAVNVESVDALVADMYAALDPSTYIDYGLITEAVGDNLDYGGLN